MEEDIGYYQEKLEIAKKLGNKQEVVAVLIDICDYLNDSKKGNDAISYGVEAWKMIPYLDDRKQEQTIYHQLGISHLHIGKYDTAREYFMESLKIARELGDKNGEMMRLENIAYCLGKEEKTKDAIDHFMKSLKIAEELGNREQEQKTYKNLGVGYRRIMEYDTARECYTKSLKIARELGDKKEERSIYEFLECMCRETGQVELALKYYKEALNIKTEMSPNGIPEVIANKRNITEGVQCLLSNEISSGRNLKLNAEDGQSSATASAVATSTEFGVNTTGKRAGPNLDNDGEIHQSSSQPKSKKARIAQGLGDEIYFQLCQKLESQMNKNDFKRFGEKMGYSMKQVNHLKQKKYPADALLSDWQNKNGNDLEKLMSIYEEMGHHDVVAMLQNAIDDESQGYGNVNPEEKANTTNSDGVDTTEKSMMEGETGQASAEDSTPPPEIQPMELKDINPTKIEWSDATKDPIDVLLVAVNDIEFRAAYQILSKPKSADSSGEFGIIYFGQIGKNKVALVQSSMGADGNIGMIMTCLDGIKELRAKQSSMQESVLE